GLLGRRPHPHLGKNFTGRFAAGANAIGDADAVITVAGQRQARKVLAARFYTLHAFEVADRILRHGGVPFVDARKQRFGIHGDNLPQFAANNLQNLVSAHLYDRFVARAAEKAANEGPIIGGPVRKFIVDEGGGKHTAAFTARYQKSEARRKRPAYFFVVTERDRRGRAVLNAGQVTGEPLIPRQRGRGGMRGGGDDPRVEAVALVSGGNSPAVMLPDYRLHHGRRL